MTSFDGNAAELPRQANSCSGGAAAGSNAARLRLLLEIINNFTDEVDARPAPIIHDTPAGTYRQLTRHPGGVLADRVPGWLARINAWVAVALEKTT